MVVLIHGNEGQNNGVSGIGIHQSDDHVSHFWWSNDLVPPLAHNGWMTVRVTWNGTTRKFYLDGSLIAEDQAEGQRHDVSAGSQLVLGGLVREFGGEGLRKDAVLTSIDDWEASWAVAKKSCETYALKRYYDMGGTQALLCCGKT